MLTTAQFVKLGRMTALISFVLGTFIFLLYFFTSSDDLLLAGYLFIIITGLANILVIIIILVAPAKDEDRRNKIQSTIGLMLLNIPVMVLYCWIAIILLDTMRITFTNSTQTTLTDINITGCETEHIDLLEAGESETVWVSISGDCTIYVDYISNGVRKKENVAGYVTPGMGGKMKHTIGGVNEKFQ